MEEERDALGIMTICHVFFRGPISLDPVFIILEDPIKYYRILFAVPGRSGSVEVKAVGVTVQPAVPVGGKATKPSGQKQKAKSEAGLPKTEKAKEETRKVENIREA